jgi:hypothetical protein
VAVKRVIEEFSSAKKERKISIESTSNDTISEAVAEEK